MVWNRWTLDIMLAFKVKKLCFVLDTLVFHESILIRYQMGIMWPNLRGTWAFASGPFKSVLDGSNRNPHSPDSPSIIRTIQNRNRRRPRLRPRVPLGTDHEMYFKTFAMFTEALDLHFLDDFVYVTLSTEMKGTRHCVWFWKRLRLDLNSRHHVVSTTKI